MFSKLKKGFIYTAIGTYANFIVQLLITSILSRLLTPKSYGVVAIMQVFIIFFSMLVEAGMGPAIIQNKKLTKADNQILFNYSSIFAIILAVFFGLFGLILSGIYNESIYQRLTWLQSLSVFFNGLNVVPTAILNKNKNFKAVNFSLLIGTLFGGLIGIISALLGAGVYALILSAIFVSGVSLSLNLLFTKLTFSKKFDLKVLGSIWDYSKNQFGFNFINYFTRNADNILVGKFMGSDSLANYNKAYQLLLLPNTLFLGIVNPVLQPVFSEYQDAVSHIRNVYYSILHFLALVGIPLSIFLSFNAREIIIFMFGNQWDGAVAPFKILALTVWIQMTYSSTGSLIQSRNQSKLLMKNGLLTAFICVSAIVIGILGGSIFCVSVSLSIGFCINFFVTFYRVTKYSLEDNLVNLLKNFISPFFLGIIMTGVLIFIKYFSIKNIILSLFINGGAFLGVLILYIYLSNEKNFIKDLLKK